MAKPMQTLRKFLDVIAKNHGYLEKTIEVTPTTSKGANYTSALFKVKMSGTNKETLNMFAKVAIVSKSLREQVFDKRMFETEKVFYTHLAKVYSTQQEKYRIPEEERLIFPKYYGSQENYMEEIMVLQDLSAEGYTMHNRREPVSWDYASNAVATLAKFHALSFSYKKDLPEEFEKYAEDMKFRLSQPFEVMKEAWTDIAARVSTILEEDEGARLKKFMADVCASEASLKKCIAPTKWKQFVHGDYKASNLLHKVEDNQITSIIPIDFQTVRCDSPITDLLYFIYSGTDGHFRKYHTKQLLEHYYGTLAKFLKYMGMETEETFSRQDFDLEYKEKLPFGLVTSILLIPVVMVEDEHAPQMDAQDASIDSFVVKYNDVSKSRIKEVISDFIELGIL